MDYYAATATANDSFIGASQALGTCTSVRSPSRNWSGTPCVRGGCTPLWPRGGRHLWPGQPDDDRTLLGRGARARASRPSRTLRSQRGARRLRQRRVALPSSTSTPLRTGRRSSARPTPPTSSTATVASTRAIRAATSRSVSERWRVGMSLLSSSQSMVASTGSPGRPVARPSSGHCSTRPCRAWEMAMLQLVRRRWLVSQRRHAMRLEAGQTARRPVHRQRSKTIAPQTVSPGRIQPRRACNQLGCCWHSPGLEPSGHTCIHPEPPAPSCLVPRK